MNWIFRVLSERPLTVEMDCVPQPLFREPCLATVGIEQDCPVNKRVADSTCNHDDAATVLRQPDKSIIIEHRDRTRRAVISQRLRGRTQFVGIKWDAAGR